MTRLRSASRVAGLFVCLFACRCAGADPQAPVVAFDFTQADTVAQWRAANDVESVEATTDGMAVVASGDDPFLVGPPVDLSAGAPLALEIKVRSEGGGAVEVFYFTDHAAAGKSVSARVAAGAWEELRLPLPPLGKKVRFRIDPPATKGGRATVASMRLCRRLVFEEPRWPRAVEPLGAEKDRLTVRSGDLSLVHDGNAFGRFDVRVADQSMAASLSRSVIGYLENGKVQYVPLPVVDGAVEVKRSVDGVRETCLLEDPQGGRWAVERSYVPGAFRDSVEITTTIETDRDRDLLFAPALVLLPGASADGLGFGARKTQALLSGLEYLGPGDASSSEADVIGPASKRRVPDSLKLTLPLMALCADGRYVAIAWEDHPAVSALFDSPDRTFGSGGHAMGLLLPGSDGRNRVEGSVIPEVPHRLKAGEPVTVKAVILGGSGRSIVPAIQQYVQWKGLPETPRMPVDGRGYDRLAAGGWLDSKIREGSLVRHAVWPGFGAQPAADAAVWMRWLAARTDDDGLRGRLTEAAAAVASAVPPEQYNASAVGHVRYPVASLVLGSVEENARRAEEQGRALVRRFEGDGSYRFRREQGKDDFARTNPSPEANGLTATHVARVLEAAAVSGDAELIEAALRLLRGLDKFHHDVPRGAQSWEVPLHTPDVLASAMLVKCYVWGYELTGEQQFLEQATYWAWTGVPFVYLRNPAEKPVGPYATIAVYGATNWVEPVWFGRPVQWCGLVYADALYRLSRHDDAGPWRKIADGITASGVQQSWPATDRERQGLLPDFYHLRAQQSDGPAINPATLQANAVRLFGGPEVYDFRRFARHGLLVHAPGAIEPAGEDERAARFKVRGWPTRPYYVLVSGWKRAPNVTVGGRAPAPDAVTHNAAEGRTVLRVEGEADVTMDFN